MIGWWDNDVGTVADWFAAVGTIGALVFTGVALRREMADRKAEAEDRVAEAKYRHETQRRQVELDEERRREHALGLSFRTQELVSGTAQVFIALRNNSTTSTFYEAVLYKPDASGVGFVEAERYGTIAPGSDRSSTITEQPLPFRATDVHLRYVDHVGRAWEQDHEGRLSPSRR